MGVFMNKLLGLTFIFSIISVFGLSAMEENIYAEAESAAPGYLVRQMEQEQYERELRRIEEARRQQREAEQREYQEQLRMRRNEPGYQPARRRLFDDM